LLRAVLCCFDQSDHWFEFLHIRIASRWLAKCDGALLEKFGRMQGPGDNEAGPSLILPSYSPNPL
jgi:hypothetical protein